MLNQYNIVKQLAKGLLLFALCISSSPSLAANAKAFQIAAPKKATVDCQRTNGDIQISFWNKKSLQIRSASGKGPLHFQVIQRSGWLFIKDKPFNEETWHLTLPKGANVRLKTINGSIKVAAGAGNVEARTVDGSISIQKAKGPVFAKTVNGAITIEKTNQVTVSTATGQILMSHITGYAQIKGVNSKIQLSQVNANRIKVKNINGSVFLRAIKAHLIEVRTFNGQISVQKLLSAPSQVHLRSFAGGIRMSWPQNKGVHVSMRTFSGGMQIPNGLNVLQKKMSKLFGYYGKKPRAQLIMRTFSGGLTLTIQKQIKGTTSQKTPKKTKGPKKR